MKLRLLSILALILIMTSIVAAQDNQILLWPVVKRCLPTPLTPDKNWSYNGVLLMHGWAGIHGIRAGSSAPYVVHWGDGILSPTGEWILSQDAKYYTEQLGSSGPIGRYIDSYGDITVQNSITGRTIKFPWYALAVLVSGPYPFGPAHPLWLDDNHFVAFYTVEGQESETKEGNLESGKIIDRPDIDLEDHEFSISPDQTRVVAFGQLYTLPKHNVIEQKVGTSQDGETSVWMRDSSRFIDIVSPTTYVSELSIFDRNGNIVEKPFVSQKEHINLGKFSANSNYFFYIVNRQGIENIHQLYILDLNKKIIYDLRVNNLQGLAWSPDGSQFATILGAGQQPILVVDIDKWQSHIVGYHTGSVLLWKSLT